jgi:hypothetical protein
VGSVFGPIRFLLPVCRFCWFLYTFNIRLYMHSWEKCDEKCAYMFNVYKNQLSRQTGSRNLTGPKMLPTIWYTYMTLVTKYQISVINSYWEKCNEKYLGRTDGRTEVKQYTPFPFGERGYNNLKNVAYLPCTYQIFFKNVCRNTGIYFFGPNMNYQSSR